MMGDWQPTLPDELQDGILQDRPVRPHNYTISSVPTQPSQNDVHIDIQRQRSVTYPYANQAFQVESHMISQQNGPMTNDWPADTRRPQALPEVDNPQNWQEMVAAADFAYASRQSSIAEANVRRLRPTASINIVREVIVETQPTMVEPQRSASIAAIRQPSATIEANGGQSSVMADQSHTITKDCLMTLVVKLSFLEIE